MSGCGDTKHSGSLTKRQTTWLLIAGACTGLVSRAAQAAAGVQKPRTQLPTLPRNSIHPNLKSFGPDRQVRQISHGDGTFRVMTRDSRVVDFREPDLRFKIDSTNLGPHPGLPIVLPAGSMGDLAWVFFAAAEEVSTFIKHQS